jgi:hypothetical protein
MQASGKSLLEQKLHQSRALSLSDLEKITALADCKDVDFVRLNPKGAVVDDVLTGVSGTIHTTREAVMGVVQTFLELSESYVRLEISRLGLEKNSKFEVHFATPEIG